MNNKIYCYIRVSTDKQEHERQEQILKEKGYIDNVNCEYIKEYYTGTTTKRPEFQKLLNKINKGDTIVTTELSRISRSVKGFNDLIDEIVEKKKVNIYIIKENFNLKANGNMDAMTKLIMNITSAYAEFERDIISDRTREALHAKKINGTKSGRPIGHPVTLDYSDENFIKVLECMINKKVGQSKAISICRFPKLYFLNKIRECYKKYNTKDYKIILENFKKEIEK